MQKAASQGERARVLVVEDDYDVREWLREVLIDARYPCYAVCNGRDALDALGAASFELVLTDLRMPEMGGMELLGVVQEKFPALTTIILTAHADIEMAVEATRRGAYDLLCKPVSEHHLLLALARAEEHRRLLATNRKLLRQLENPPIFGELIGKSPAMLEVFQTASRVAKSNATVLLTGESGTGKEAVARAIHTRSRRHDKRLCVINCGAMPEHLVESILFGHRKGAFTGATEDHVGLLNHANGGTAFFDEIGELAPHIQVKLLRVIQERTFTPVGAPEEIGVDVRIVAATNRDLRREVEEGRFREDLFYRLNVVPIHMPPVRERGDDVAALVAHFLTEFSEDFPQIAGIDDEAMARMTAYPWPGNVRELRNAIERAVSLAVGHTITVADLPETVRDYDSSGDNRPLLVRGEGVGTWNAELQRAQHDYATRLLALHEGNVSHAAENAGMSRKAFYKLLRDAQVDARAFRRGR